MATPPHIVHQISKTIIKPSPLPQLTEPKIINLSPWDLSMLSLNYIECGLLFSIPPHSLHIDELISALQASLSAALFHFYPLAGRLITKKQDNNLIISLQYSNNSTNIGAEFIHAAAKNLTMADVSNVVKHLFPYYGVVNYDGHFLPLLAVQVTELADGVFLGCSMNHAIADGMSFWNFFRSWAEISRNVDANGTTNINSEITISHDRWFVNGVDPPIKLPFSDPRQFIHHYTPPSDIRVRIFHFSSQSIAQLKWTASEEINDSSKISSFQALSSLIWRSVTRARSLQPDQKTSCRLASNDRSKLSPPLSSDYFGNYVTVIAASTTVGDLLGNGIGHGARLLKERVSAHSDEAIRAGVREWAKEPVILSPCKISPLNVSVLGSPHFPVYECDFGWGRPAGLRTGSTFLADGVVAAFPAAEGGRSVDLEVYLKAETMQALELNEEFMNVVSHK